MYGAKNIHLAFSFSRLFSISNNYDWTVDQVGIFVNDNLTQDLRWKRPLFVYHEVTLSLVSDRWVWSHSDDDVFFVASAYSCLLQNDVFRLSPTVMENQVLPFI